MAHEDIDEKIAALNEKIAELNETTENCQLAAQELAQGEGVWNDRMKLRWMNLDIEALRTMMEWISEADKTESFDDQDDRSQAVSSVYSAIQRLADTIATDR